VNKVWNKRKILKVVSVCVCGFVSKNAEIERLKEQGLWKEELEPQAWKTKQSILALRSVQFGKNDAQVLDNSYLFDSAVLSVSLLGGSCS
jgi:hypothetical protein